MKTKMVSLSLTGSALVVLGLAACSSKRHAAEEKADVVEIDTMRDEADSMRGNSENQTTAEHGRSELNRENAAEPVVTEEIGVIEVETEEPVAVAGPETGDEAAIGAVGGREDTTTVGAVTPCDRKVIAKSPGAVGNPCETNAAFMRSLGLSQDAIARVRFYEETLARRMAH